MGIYARDRDQFFFYLVVRYIQRIGHLYSFYSFKSLVWISLHVDSLILGSIVFICLKISLLRRRVSACCSVRPREVR